MPTTPPRAIRCADGCGRSIADLSEAGREGWSWLSIVGQFRCPDCHIALRAAATLPGTSGETLDTLPPDSRGALRRETASTIAAPTVNKNPQSEA